MPITVVVRSEAENEPALTFDGVQRVVIGRGASCDVRLPDPTVSHRHASLHADGAEFLLTDEGGTNGTFVGAVRIAPHTSRIVRSGDAVRLGRVWIELRLDQRPATRDLAVATREIALALVSRALSREGRPTVARVLVAEGPDRGAVLSLSEEGRSYALGRAPACDLPLSDADASREHARVERRAGGVVVRDLGAKNGTFLGEARLPADKDVAWRPTVMIRLGRTVLALEEPVGDALARIEREPDERLGEGAAAQAGAGAAGAPPSTDAAWVVALGDRGPSPPVRKRRMRLSAVDLVVVVTALGVLAASIAGLVWLLRG